ncbi:MAG: hypothetical protein KJ667_05680, partial [Alphaproteobacteria bacterium]|nr:hypothetical protein [Alphaproteobacteria bacterium]
QWQKQAQQVLITSQYSQKQAEELKAELVERDRRAEARRQQIEQQRRTAGKPGAQTRPTSGTGPAKTGPRTGNENRKTGPIEQQRVASAAAAVKNFDIQGLWKKVRGQDDKSATTSEGPTTDKRAAS